MKLFRTAVAGLAVVTLMGSSLVAVAGPLDEPILSKDLPEVDGPWDQGDLEFSFMTGPYFGPNIPTGPAKEDMNYWANNFRIGINLTPIVAENTIFRGNLQFVGELFLAEYFNTEGGGSVCVGPNALLRYNFIPENSRFVPYVQLGPGLIYTDTDNHAIGSDLLFQLNIAVGTRVMLNDEWSVNLECGWHHMSTANTSDTNLGSNEMGGLVGVSYFFD